MPRLLSMLSVAKANAAHVNRGGIFASAMAMVEEEIPAIATELRLQRSEDRSMSILADWQERMRKRG